jgi:hypothetical protein
MDPVVYTATACNRLQPAAIWTVTDKDQTEYAFGLLISQQSGGLDEVRLPFFARETPNAKQNLCVIWSAKNHP